MTQIHRQTSLLLVPVSVALLALAGCGQSKPPAEAAATPPAEAAPDAAAQAEQQALAEQAAAEQAKADELAAKEKELADREAALKQKEVEAELAKRAAPAAKPASTAAKAGTAAAAGATAAAKKEPPPPPPPIVVPAGTPLAIEILANVNTKKAIVGDPVQARLAKDVVVGGRVVAKAGAPVSGSVKNVDSGSNAIGGTPKIVLTFADLQVVSGAKVAIAGKYSQSGTDETGKDTAKVVGGAAAGAIIGNQVNTGKGAVVGGLLGGAAGAAAAKKTGGEVKIPAGTVITVNTGAAFEVKVQ